MSVLQMAISGWCYQIRSIKKPEIQGVRSAGVIIAYYLNPPPKTLVPKENWQQMGKKPCLKTL